MANLGEPVPTTESNAKSSMSSHDIPSFGEGLRSTLRNIFDQHAGTNSKWTRHQVDTFWEEFQTGHDHLADLTDDDRVHLTGDEVDFESFVRYMASPAASVLKPLPADDQDMEWPLNNYFINSSHHTCLNGAQPPSSDETTDSENGGFSTDAYKDALLSGCRSIEISICDGDWVPSEEKSDAQAEKLEQELTGLQRLWFRGLQKALDKMEARAKDDRFISDIRDIRESWRTVYQHEPRVRDGEGATIQDFLFSDVCQTIKEHAFAATDLPLVVNLDIHCEPQQQLAVVRIINKTWAEFLVPAVAEAEVAVLPTPAELRRKILIKVKPPHAEENLVRTSDFSSLFSKKADKKETGIQVIEPLMELAVYTREIPFTSLEQAEAASAPHVFALSDTALAQTHATQPAELFRHNRHFLMQTMPSAPGAISSSPLGHWQKGVQMAALRPWPTTRATTKEDATGRMINEAMFAGTGGFVRKPDGYRGPQMPASRPVSSAATEDEKDHDPDAQRRTPQHRTLSRLAIHVLATQDLPLPPAVTADGVRPYATLELHAVPHPYEELRRRGEAPGSSASASVSSSSMPPAEKELPFPGGNAAQVRDRTRADRGRAPDFGGATLGLLNVDGVVPELAFAALGFWHEERPRDLPMAWACVRLDRLHCGYRVLRLRDMQGRPSDGLVLVRIEKRMW